MDLKAQNLVRLFGEIMLYQHSNLLLITHNLQEFPNDHLVPSLMCNQSSRIWERTSSLEHLYWTNPEGDSEKELVDFSLTISYLPVEWVHCVLLILQTWTDKPIV